MADESKVIKVRGDAGSLGGLAWVAGWLFTIGYLHLPVAKAIFALVIWPYYLGTALAP
jgi:hypothetical protein